MPIDASFECVAISPALQPALSAFFAQVVAAGLDRDFHPHPFTSEHAAQLVRQGGRDYYGALKTGEVLAGYGMLRGWDEGFEVPSLGIAILPAYQRQGLGRLLMQHLHGVARERGAKRIRLKVYDRNAGAVSLYTSLGYKLEPIDGGQYVGFLDLATQHLPKL